jgi:hypothetical protein
MVIRMDGDLNLWVAILYGYPPFFGLSLLIFSSRQIAHTHLICSASRRASTRRSSAKPIFCDLIGKIRVMSLIHIYSVEQRLWLLSRRSIKINISVYYMSRYDN